MRLFKKVKLLQTKKIPAKFRALLSKENLTKSLYGFKIRRNGAWLSLVERCVRDAEAAGSNPVAPICYIMVFLSIGHVYYVLLS